MRIAFVANSYLDPGKHNSWSGLPFFIRRSLERVGVTVETCILSEPNPLGGALRYAYWRFLLGRRYVRACEARVLRHYSKEIDRRLRSMKVDAVFCPSSWPVAYFEGAVPTVFWTDACFAGMVDFYKSFANLAESSMVDGHAAERAALRNCARAIYSSEWAASTARDRYSADPSKIRVVPFGGNILEKPSIGEVAMFVSLRESRQCNLLLIGVDWERKGAEIAVETVKSLNSRGMPSRLTIVGCVPPRSSDLPPFVEVIPFISKETYEGGRRFTEICRRSYFLIMPSRADCTPVAIAEANYFGLPCLATDVGGIPSIVTDEINGHLFHLRARGDSYADYILDVISDISIYRSLAIRSAEEADRRFSWEASGAKVLSILSEVVALKPRARSPVPQTSGAGKLSGSATQ
jgi:glycosyltransferase involved in cell wall biosynthesis